MRAVDLPRHDRYTSGMTARHVYAVAALLALTACYACWCRSPLIWDGAYQFNATLILQSPYFYHARFHTFFLWWPTVWASRCTDNVTFLQSVFGLPFLLVPAFSVLTSWWLVRKDAPYLILWVIFGVAAGTLPGQIFIINDSIFQQNIFWPIFMSLFVPLTKPKKLLLGILIVFQFVHPLGMLLFLGAAAAAGAMAWGNEKNRRRYLVRAGVMGALFIAAALKIYITSRIPALWDGYAAEEAHWASARDRWGVGVRGWPLHGLWFMWSGAAMLLVRSRMKAPLSARTLHRLLILLALIVAVRAVHDFKHPVDAIFPVVACVLLFIFLSRIGRERSNGRLLGLLPIICLLVGMGCWIYWASDGRLWWKALDYRRWIGPLTAPFFIMALLDAFFASLSPVLGGEGWGEGRIDEGRNSTDGPSPQPSPPRTGERETDRRRDFRNSIALMLAMTFALVICIQSTVWHSEGAKLMTEVMRYPTGIVPESKLPWTDGTPLDHWAITDYVMAMQGKQPTKLLLDPRAEERMYESPPVFPHADFYPYAKDNPADARPRPLGWFDLRPLLRQIEREPQPAKVEGPQRLDIKMTPN